MFSCFPGLPTLGLVVCLTVSGQSATALPLVSLQSINSPAKITDNTTRLLTDALKDLKQLFGVDILYGDQLVRGVTVPINSIDQKSDLEENLKLVLKNTGLHYRKVKNGAYLITGQRADKKLTSSTKSVPEVETSMSSSDIQVPEINAKLLTSATASKVVDQVVKGRVTGETSEGLPGVNVVLKGTTRGTTTDIDGRYQLNLPEVKNNTLVFSLVGYTPQEVIVGASSSIDIQLVPDNKTLNEVVVVGYGSQRKTDLTGSVASVQEKDFTPGVNNSALQLLNGKASGVQISQSSSAPGGGIAIRIRGAGSINSSNEALIVVDGLPGATTESLSPGDIESIQILKDASAAAIYGSRAANGVVLITTKKGKQGIPQVNYSTYVGSQTVAKRLDLLNTAQYIQVLNDLSNVQMGKPRYTPDQITAIGAGTDWQGQAFRTALAQNHQLSFSGGADKSNYYVGLNYLNQDGVVLNSGLKKYNIRLNYQINPSDKFKVTLNMNANRSAITNILTTNSGNENAGPINAALQFDPTIPTGLDATGRYPYNPTISLENPLALLNGVNQKYVENRTFGTLSSDYTPIKGWTTTLRLGGDISNGRTDSYNSTVTQKGLSSGGIGSINSADYNHWISELFSTYTHTYGGIHQLSVLAGATLEEFNNQYVGASSISFLSDVTQTNLLQSGDGDRGDNVSSDRSTNRLNSYLSRINYTYKDKYLLTASLRTDGTSRFSDQNKYASFPSVALGWRLSEEPFIQQSNLFSDLKLRASYGQSGNQAINNFETLQTLVAGGKAILGGGLIQGLEPARIPNTNLKWETTEEMDLGLDFSILKGRVSGSLEYYNKTTRDQLFNKPLPTTSGFQNIRVNFGKVRNQGIDLALETRNVINAFKWTTNLTFSTLKNQVIELPDFISQVLTGSVGFTGSYAITRVGSPIQSFYGYQTNGIYQTKEEIAASPEPTAQPGAPRFVDQNGDGKITPDDRVILGNPLPKMLFGLTNTFNYKGFNLSFLLQGVQGVSSLDNNIVESLYPINFDRNRIAVHYLDRWTPANPGAAYPSGVNSSAYGGARAINNLTVTDASFVRLKNITLGYTIPTKLVRSASVYVAADNVFTITKFLGFDPDANASGTGVGRASYNSYPLNRTIRFGVNLSF